jgi:iron complex outermembrane receptor protein
MPITFRSYLGVRASVWQRSVAALVCTTALISASQALAQSTPPAPSQSSQSAAPPPQPTATSSQSTAASSQTAGASGDRVQEIVVTAEFRKENLQNTPIAITSVNSRMLEARGQTNITQVAAQAPNVSLRPAGSSLGNTLVAYIRGVGQGDFNYALEPGVGIYIDDVYFATATGAEFNLIDLDRVEILRGPQGTLAGKNSIGGAIKLYSKKPDGNGGGYIEGTYGSDNLIQGRAAADFTIVPEQLFARVSLVSRHQDGYVTMIDYKCAHPGPIDTGVAGLGTIPNNLPTLVHDETCELGKAGGVNYTAGRVALRYNPDSRLDVNLSADFDSDNSEVQPAVLKIANYPNKTPPINGVPFGPWFITGQKYTTYANSTDFDTAYGPYTSPTISHMQQWGGAADIQYNFTEKLQLRSITSYRRYTSKFGDIADGSPVSVALQFHTLKYHQFTQEVRLNDTLGDGLLDFTLGGFYFKGNGRQSGRIDLSYSHLDFLSDDLIPSESIAGFVNAALHPAEKLTLDGGLRYSGDKKSYTFGRIAPDHSGPAPIVGGLSGVAGHFKHTRLDYRFAIDYNWTHDIMTYAQISTGFKGGGINPRPFIPAQVVSFDPETLTAYEVGAKTEFFDHRLRLNAAAFYNKYNNIQLTVFSCPQFSPSPTFPCFAPLNAGTADVDGAELELNAFPTNGLELDGSLSYLHFKYTTISPNVGIPGVRGVQMGMVPPYTPSWKASFGVQYAIDLGRGVGSLTPRVDVDYESSVYGNATNAATNRIPSRTIANARLTYRSPDDNWELALEVTNLTDKYYALTMDDSLATAGYMSIGPARPREWLVSLRRNF